MKSNVFMKNSVLIASLTAAISVVSLPTFAAQCRVDSVSYTHLTLPTKA